MQVHFKSMKLIFWISQWWRQWEKNADISPALSLCSSNFSRCVEGRLQAVPFADSFGDHFLCCAVGDQAIKLLRFYVLITSLQLFVLMLVTPFKANNSIQTVVMCFILPLSWPTADSSQADSCIFTAMLSSAVSPAIVQTSLLTGAKQEGKERMDCLQLGDSVLQKSMFRMRRARTPACKMYVTCWQLVNVAS